MQKAFLADSARLAAVLTDAATDTRIRFDYGNTNAAHGVQFDVGEQSFGWRRDELDTDFLQLDRIIASSLTFFITQIAILAQLVIPQRQAGAGVDARQSHVDPAFCRQFQRLNGPGRTDLRAEVTVLMTARVLRMRHRCP